jgi:hypothetical protein
MKEFGESPTVEINFGSLLVTLVEPSKPEAVTYGVKNQTQAWWIPYIYLLHGTTRVINRNA